MPDDLHNAHLLFDGERLRLARQLRGLKKTDLAGLIRVTPAAVSQYESGRAKPSTRTLAELSLALNVTPGFFARRRASIPLTYETWHFRSLRATRSIERARVLARIALLAELLRLVEKYVELPSVAIPEHLSDALSQPAIEAAAARIRDEWGLGDGPIGNVVMLLEAKGAVVARLAADSHNLDAFSGRVEGRPFIFLASDKSDAARSRFDAAHELGHLVLHQDVAPGSSSAERQAQHFAACFLLPRQQIARELPTRLDWDHLAELKLRWGVSIAALLYRARDVGHLSEHSYRRAMTHLTAMGWRRKEPADLGAPEEPTMIAQSLELLTREVGLSLSTISDELTLPIEDVKSLVIGVGRTPKPLVVIPGARGRDDNDVATAS